jgi:hypothetical protein
MEGRLDSKVGIYQGVAAFCCQRSIEKWPQKAQVWIVSKIVSEIALVSAHWSEMGLMNFDC